MRLVLVYNFIEYKAGVVRGDRAIPFYIHTGVWKANSLGVCQKHFPREPGTKIVFPRGSGQVFQRGHTG